MGRIYSHLSAEERGVIMAMLAQGSSARAMATVLGRAPSTVARELMRNGHRLTPVSVMGRPRLPYDASQAGRRALRLARKPRRRRKLASDSALWRQVRAMQRCSCAPWDDTTLLRKSMTHF